LLRLFGWARAPEQPPPQNRRSWLIRVIGSKQSEWTKTSGDARELGGEAFSRIAERVSTFLVSSPEEELIAAAAHQVKRGNVGSDPVALLRIELDEVRAQGIEVLDTDGDTGIASADQAHRDVVGDWDKYEALSAGVIREIRNGADRVRRIQRPVILIQFWHFLLLPDGQITEITADSRERCRKHIEQNLKHLPEDVKADESLRSCLETKH